MKILGLDPGDVTGYGLIDVTSNELKVIDYGTIPQRWTGLPGLLYSVWDWLTENVSGEEVAFEDFIPSMKLRTTKESVEVRGVIRLWCYSYRSGKFAAYSPAAIRGQIGATNKAEVRKWVIGAVGEILKGQPDHIPDALAVAICHAIKLGIWQPRIDLSNKTAETRTKRVKAAKSDTGTMTAEQLRKGLNDGSIKVGR